MNILFIGCLSVAGILGVGYCLVSNIQKNETIVSGKLPKSYSVTIDSTPLGKLSIKSRSNNPWENCFAGDSDSCVSAIVSSRGKM